MRSGRLRAILGQQPGPEIDHQNRLDIELFTELQKLVVAELVRNPVALMSDRDRSCRRAPGHVVDHVTPVDVVHVGATRKTGDRDLHLAQQLLGLRAQLMRARQHRGLRTDLTPAGSLHELAEQSRVDRMQHGVGYGYSDLFILISRLRRPQVTREGAHQGQDHGSERDPRDGLIRSRGLMH